MKLIKNSGNDRVIDELRRCLTPHSTLDVATPSMAKRKSTLAARSPNPAHSTDRLLGELRELIEAARLRVAETANSALTQLHWHVG